MLEPDVRRRLERLAEGRISDAALHILLAQVDFHLENGRGTWGVAELDQCLLRWQWKRNKVPRRFHSILSTHVGESNARFNAHF